MITTIKTNQITAITTQPTTRTYNHGATFDKTGMVVKATYTDSQTAVAITGYTVTDETIVYGQTSVTLTYTENGVKKALLFDKHLKV